MKVKSSPEVISTLQSLILKLENNEYYYDWGHGAKCNCGLFVRELMNQTEEQMCEFAIPYWSDLKDRVLDSNLKRIRLHATQQDYL